MIGTAARRAALAGMAVCALASGAALADASGFLGSWSNAAAKDSGFLGMWSDANGIARIEVTRAGANHFRIHLYGLCKPQACDWGEQLGHERSDAPDSADVTSLSADFSLGYGVKHLTLHPGPGGALRFTVATDFTDHSGRHDFETSGSLAPLAAAQNGPAPPVSVQPGVPTSGEGLPPSVTAPADLEECERINPEDIYVSPGDRGWSVNDFDHVILKFGPDKVAAVKAARVMAFYRFDEQCFVRQPHAKMIYWRTRGQVPREAMPGQDCVALDPAKVRAAGAKVMDGDRVVIDFDGDVPGAKRASSVIQNYRLNRQCFVARPNDKMVYWLSQ